MTSFIYLLFFSKLFVNFYYVFGVHSGSGLDAFCRQATQHLHQRILNQTVKNNEN